MGKAKRSSLTLRLPEPLLAWLAKRAEENFSSKNDEIIRLIRECQKSEKMSAATGEGLANTAPAAASSNNAALAGGASITNGL